MVRTLLLLSSVFFMWGCGGENSVGTEERDTTATIKPSVKNIGEPNAGNVTNAQREQVQKLIATSKSAMDSIDSAYTAIRNSGKLLKLTLEERQTVNEVLQALNTIKELIILETQSAVIRQLKEKTSELHKVMNEMSEKSGKLNEIAARINKVSAIVKKTTDTLAAALSAGIIKPNMLDLTT